MTPTPDNSRSPTPKGTNIQPEQHGICSDAFFCKLLIVIIVIGFFISFCIHPYPFLFVSAFFGIFAIANFNEEDFINFIKSLK